MKDDSKELIDGPELLTIAQICQNLNIGSTTAYALVAQGELRSIRIGRKVLVPKLECEDFVRRAAIRAGWRMPSSSKASA